MRKRPLIIMAVAAPLLGVAALIVYGILFFSYGPRPISPSVALGLLKNCDRFSAAGTREVKTITRIQRLSPSEVNNYSAEFVWRWRSDPEFEIGSIAEFEYKEERWNLSGFREQGGNWVQVRCRN